MKLLLKFILLLIGIIPVFIHANAQDDTKNTVISTVEIGVRGLSLDGDEDKYRSDLNFNPGLRIFDSSFLIKSKKNEGKLFDTFLVNSSGWDTDPHGYLRANVEKTRWYKFDTQIRRFHYSNNLKNIALGQHTFDTEHKMGDFDLTLFPQNENLRINAGYSMDRFSGPALSTYMYTRDDYPLETNIRSSSNEYRIGADTKLWILDISFLQGLRYFKDDTTYTITSPQTGNNITGGSSLSSFNRDLPVRGRIAFSRLSLHTLIKQKLDFTGRFAYSHATTRSDINELASGRDIQNNILILRDQFDGNGYAKRPTATGDVGLTFIATKKLRISETFRIHNFHIDSNQAINEILIRRRPTGVSLPNTFATTSGTRYFSQRYITNAIEFDYQFNKRLAFHFGHRYIDRLIRLNQLNITPTRTNSSEGAFDLHTNVIFGGFKIKPVPPLTTYLDFEHGKSNNVFTRLANHDFVNFRVRNRLTPHRSLTLNIDFVTKDNNNPSTTEGASVRWFGIDVNTRSFNSSIDWTPNGKFALSSGYTYMHHESDAAIIFFINNNIRREGLSQYVMKNHFAYLNTHIKFHPRWLLFSSYSIHKDRGQDDMNLLSTSTLLSSYPLQFQSVESRLSFKLHKRVEWSVGYQYYDYKERLPIRQDYRAHLPYASLRFYFNRAEN
jgi:hypothetical protein